MTPTQGDGIPGALAAQPLVSMIRVGEGEELGGGRAEQAPKGRGWQGLLLLHPKPPLELGCLTQVSSALHLLKRMHKSRRPIANIPFP